MKYRDLSGLIVLGMLWGASFLFTKVAVPEFGAIPLMGVRVTLAAAILLPLLLRRARLEQVLQHWRAIALMGVLHYAIPFSLFAYSMLSLSAGYSSIINASAPLFAGLVARFWLGERLSASRSAGLVLGVLGVVLLVSDRHAIASDSSTLAALASVLAALCYGLSAVFMKKKLGGVDPVAVACGSMVVAALVLLPISFLLWPATAPSTSAWSMAVVLGAVCTATAFVLYFRLIVAIGPSRAITVTFLIPAFGVVFGALFLDEQTTTPMIIGGVVVAVGTALSTGLVDLHRLTRKAGVLTARTLGVLIAVTALDAAWLDAQAEEWQANSGVDVAVNSLSYRIESDWDVGSLWFARPFPDRASESTFMAHLRYQFRPGHKLGAEYLADGDAPRDGELKLGYFGSVGRRGSVKLLAGFVASEEWQPLARLEFSWSLN